MYTELQSEQLISIARKIRSQIYAPLQWVSATRMAIARQVVFDVSLVARFVAERQHERRLTRGQCALLGDISSELEFQDDVSAESMLDDYEESYSMPSSLDGAEIPTVRLSIFRKCDTTFGTDYAAAYHSFLMQVIGAFLALSKGLNDQALCIKEFESLLNQRSFGCVVECSDFEGRLKLAESLNKKLAKLSLAALHHPEFASEFVWLDRRDNAIEYVLQTMAIEVVLLNVENQSARLDFLGTISPTLGVYGTRSARLAQFKRMLSDKEQLNYASERPAWVELIAFANQVGEPELKTTALKLLCEFGSDLLTAASPLSEKELDWQGTVLAALNEAAQRSGELDVQEADEAAARELSS